MAVFRVSKDKNYTTINNTGLKDKRLSWKAKGILAYILSLPDDWVFYMDEVAEHAKDKLDSLRSGMKELKDHGYIQRFPIKENGKIVRWETIVYEVPHKEIPLVEKPQMEFPQVGVPQMEIPMLLSTKELSTNIPNTDKPNTNKKNSMYSTEFEELWSIYPRKIDKKKAYKSFKTAIKNNNLEMILEGTKQYAEQITRNKTETKYIKHASTFLNNESFLNDFSQEKGGNPSGGSSRNNEIDWSGKTDW